MIKHLILLKIQNIMDINVALLHWFISFIDRKPTLLTDKSAFGGGLKNEYKELHKTIIKKFEK